MGDRVYLQLRPYVQTSGSQRNNQNIYKYFGPFMVLQRIDIVAYKLDLPLDYQILVIHVFQLKSICSLTVCALSGTSVYLAIDIVCSGTVCALSRFGARWISRLVVAKWAWALLCVSRHWT